MNEKVRDPKEIKVFKTWSGKGWWICPRSGREGPAERKVLNTYIRNLIWNKYRLCWILPSDEGKRFFHANFPGEEINNVDQEDGNLELFPTYPNFQPGEEKQEQKEHKEERKYEGQNVERLSPHARPRRGITHMVGELEEIIRELRGHL
jgi:hypothetical protein